MANLNLCQFIGRIGKIETRYLPNGDAVTNCSIAVNESWKDQNGEKHEKTEWIKITAYRKLAEIMEKYCSKGMLIYVSGKMQTRKYTDKQGIEKDFTDIIANEMKMIGGNHDQREESKKQVSNSGTGFYDDIEDIPF